MGSYELTAIWRHGYKAAICGLTVDDNPYEGGEEKLAWVNGFKAGMERTRHVKEVQDGDGIN